MASLPQPVMLVHETDIVKERAKHTINLEIIGTKRSIAEALLLKATVSILKDNGYKDFSLEINSIGDKESSNKFGKELTNYYKKNLNSLSAHCRQNFKKDAFSFALCRMRSDRRAQRGRTDLDQLPHGRKPSAFCRSA